MYISFKELEKDLLRNFYVESYYSNDTRMISDFEVFKVDKNGSFDQPKANTLYICEYRQLRYLQSFTEFRSPLLCIVNDNDYLGEILLAHKSILLVYNASIDEVALFLANLMYKYGRKSSDILEISELLLRCKNLDELLDKGYQILGNPIVVTDDSQKIICMTAPALTRNTAYRNILDMDYLPVGHPYVPAFDHTKPPCDFPSLYLGDDIKPSVICKELSIGDSLKGYLNILCFNSEAKEDDFYLIELLSNLVVSHLIECKRQMRFDKNDKTADFFRNIIKHKCGSPDQILKKQKSLGLVFDNYIYALMIVYKNDAEGHPISFPDLGKQLAPLLPYGYSFIYKNALFLLFSLNDMRTDLTPLFEPLRSILDSYGLVTGVSYPFKSITHLRTHADQALCALQIGSALDRDACILYYRDYAIYHMLELSASLDTLRNFVLPQFNLLREHCKKNDNSLLTTVRVYLESQCNKSKTAKKLYTHPNTIKYRLAQAEEIMGLKLDDPENVMNLMLSFKILNYASHFSPGDPRSE